MESTAVLFFVAQSSPTSTADLQIPSEARAPPPAGRPVTRRDSSGGVVALVDCGRVEAP